MTKVKPNGEVHPVAAIFPMLPGDELDELATDIQAHGLRQPIVLDKDGVLIDGRNRLAACEMVGVEPTFVQLNGENPEDYILSVNLARRHLTRGQRAMLTVEATFRLGRKLYGQSEEVAEELEITVEMLSQARSVRRYASDLVDAVIAGTVTLHSAYGEAMERKNAATKFPARMAELQANAPDLALMVREETLSISEAWSAWQTRKTEREREKRRTTNNYADSMRMLWALMLGDDFDVGQTVLNDWDRQHLSGADLSAVVDLYCADGVRDLARRLGRFADRLDAERGGCLP